VPGQDSRRLMFARQIELLDSLNPAWAGRQALEHEGVLSRHPFRDNS